MWLRQSVNRIFQFNDIIAQGVKSIVKLQNKFNGHIADACSVNFVDAHLLVFIIPHFILGTHYYDGLRTEHHHINHSKILHIPDPAHELCACMRACVHACMRACVRACVLHF